jgi:hypothetical protein
MPLVGVGKLISASTKFIPGTGRREHKEDVRNDSRQKKAFPVKSCTGTEGSRKVRLPDVKTIGTCRCEDCQPYGSAAFTHQEIFLVIITLRS